MCKWIIFSASVILVAHQYKKYGYRCVSRVFLRHQSFPIGVNWFGNIQGKMNKTCMKIEKSATFEKKPQFPLPSPALGGNPEKRSKLWNGSSFDKLAWSVLDFSRDTFCAKFVQERDFTGSLISLQIIDTLKLKINFQYLIYNPLSGDYNSTEIHLKNWSSWAFFGVCELQYFL